MLREAVADILLLLLPLPTSRDGTATGSEAVYSPSLPPELPSRLLQLLLLLLLSAEELAEALDGGSSVRVAISSSTTAGKSTRVVLIITDGRLCSESGEGIGWPGSVVCCADRSDWWPRRSCTSSSSSLGKQQEVQRWNARCRRISDPVDRGRVGHSSRISRN